MDLVPKERMKEVIAAVMALMRATFETHVYECEGRIYQQMDGCPTGLRPSGPISRVVMDFWINAIRDMNASQRN